jgi:DNA end-binding protein Ku
MPRTLWSGSLSFGLVNVPVALVSAVQDKDVHFNQLDKKTGARLHVERYCKEEDVAIPYEEIASGYPRSDGDGYVMLTDLELEAAQPEKTRTIDISEFVDLPDIDPIFFDHPYFLVPKAEGEGALRAYKLLVGVMEQTERVALGTFVMRTKEYLVALRVQGGLLQLVTMKFADEIRSTDDLQNLPMKKHQPSKAEVEHAVALVEELSCDWEPERYEDRHRKRLRKIVNDKKKGKTIKAPEAPEVPAAVPDLMAALRESLEAARGGGDGGDGDDEKAKASKSGGGGAKSKSRAKAKA